MPSAVDTTDIAGNGAARARVQCLRQSATLLQDVHGAFSAWQHLSTSVAGLDSLLNVAGVCGGVFGGDDGCNVESVIGGLPVGGLHEFYGPPLSGKSWILRRVGAGYVRRMTGYRQWYQGHLGRAPTWTVKVNECTRAVGDGARSTENDDDQNKEIIMRGVCQPSESVSLATVLEDWDLYVCLVSGAGAGGVTRRLTVSPPSSDLRSWMEELLAPFDSPSAQGRKGEAADLDSSCRRPWQQQRNYAEQHIHFCMVHSPNELLDFLERLSDDAGCSVAPPASRIHPQSCHGFTATAMRGQKRRRSPDTVVSTSQTLPLLSASLPQRTCRLQRQRLLLLDGLDSLWMHPSLGNHSATHTGQLFSGELHRQLRKVLLPRLGCSPLHEDPSTPSFSSTAASPTPLHSQHVLYSTVVLANGCHGSNRGVLTAPQLKARLGGPTGGVEGWVATLPRPSGGAVWCKAADTRCLVEPAHPGLLSIPTSTSFFVEPVKPSSGPGDVYQERQGDPSSFDLSTARSRESLVTVVKGGARVAATWILHEVP